MKRILITGASGLTGSHIAEYFSANGEDCTCLIRKHSNDTLLKKMKLRIVKNDITNINNLSHCFQNINQVIHTAAKVGDWGKYEEFYEVNVIGTLNVLKASLKNGIKDIIITGSISCYGEENSSMVKDETCSYNSHYNYFLDKMIPSGMNFYRDTKALANIEAKKFAKKHGLNLTIINPAWIYGEREFNSGFYEYIKTSKKGMRIIPGSFKNKFHSIYVRDLAKIYYLAFKKNLKGINEFLAVAPKAEYQYIIFDLLSKEAGLKKPLRLPKYIFYPPAIILEIIYKLFKIKTPPLINRSRVNMFYDNIEYSPNKIKKELNFEADYSLEESINKTIKWYKDNKLI